MQCTWTVCVYRDEIDFFFLIFFYEKELHAESTQHETIAMSIRLFDTIINSLTFITFLIRSYACVLFYNDEALSLEFFRYELPTRYSSLTWDFSAVAAAVDIKKVGCC